ncbi:MAG: N-acetyl-gamma-glutamyl-phosphate reductase [SAR86 cluster bacterium]|uniref:N-acetyl-gamma-glutamyl-phosphate reductase n=1 Tax=SAR86 cluster bacterium TaxID=2030880 RepID=A0A2A5AY66_9GAMM|nr:MAG: N-acetyl-gamma-glutamyl-phosphate reductase [SAR86 cluster bacterium]
MIKAGIIGATGYTGVELLRLLAPRTDVEISVVTSRELVGSPVHKHFPNLRGHLDLNFSAPDIDALAQCDVVFYATPHGVAMDSVAELLAKDVKVIDLSADFRIKDIALWEQWYNTTHSCPELVADAVYGLPEINREAIKSAKLIAVPGCYPTAIQLGFLPLLENNLIDSDHLIADAKSGVSGAGRKAAEDFLLCEATESIRAYAVSGHRHHPEICQGLSEFNKGEVKLTFIPHLTPMIRGILATLYAPVKSGIEVTIEQLQSVFEDRYAEEPFVDVLPQGEVPATRNVKGSNKCQISVSYSEHTNMVVVLAAEDNLVKGASGQAIHNMNIMFGLDESAGLQGIALLP